MFVDLPKDGAIGQRNRVAVQVDRPGVRKARDRAVACHFPCASFLDCDDGVRGVRAAAAVRRRESVALAVGCGHTMPPLSGAVASLALFPGAVEAASPFEASDGGVGAVPSCVSWAVSPSGFCGGSCASDAVHSPSARVTPVPSIAVIRPSCVVSAFPVCFAQPASEANKANAIIIETSFLNFMLQVSFLSVSGDSIPDLQKENLKESRNFKACFGRR